MNTAGSLSVVGTGIKPGLQTTSEARTCIERAGKVLYLIPDPSTRGWIEGLNPSAETLETFYALGKPRRDTYDEMVDEIMRWVHKGLDVCVAFYGHPGVLADPAHAAIRRARGEGFPARMLPGVSAEDGLFADLGVDPGDGCQSYEATDFLLSPPTFDHRVSLILWQVAGVGMRTGGVEPDRGGLRLLAQHLERRYGPDHPVVLYESSPYPIGEASIDRMRLCELGEADVTAMATLFVPPLRGRTLDRAAARALGVVPDQDPAAT